MNEGRGGRPAANGPWAVACAGQPACCWICWWRVPQKWHSQEVVPGRSGAVKGERTRELGALLDKDRPPTIFFSSESRWSLRELGRAATVDLLPHSLGALPELRQASRPKKSIYPSRCRHV